MFGGRIFHVWEATCGIWGLAPQAPPALAPGRRPLFFKVKNLKIHFSATIQAIATKFGRMTHRPTRTPPPLRTDVSHLGYGFQFSSAFRPRCRNWFSHFYFQPKRNVSSSCNRELWPVALTYKPPREVRVVSFERYRRGTQVSHTLSVCLSVCLSAQWTAKCVVGINFTTCQCHGLTLSLKLEWTMIISVEQGTIQYCD